MFSLFFLIASLLAVEAKLTDGQLLNGELQSIANGRVTLKTDSGKRELDSLGVDKLIFSDQTAASSTPTILVELTDGSSLGANSASVTSDETQQRKSGFAELVVNEQKSKCPLPAIRSIRYSVENELLEQWQEIRKKADEVSTSDLLVINRKGNLDYLVGVIEGFSAEQIRFEYSGDVLSIPLSKAAGLIFAKKAQTLPAAKFVVATGQSVWQLKELQYAGDKFEMTSVSGARHQLATADIRSIEFIRTGVVYASDLEAQDIGYEPFLRSDVIDASLSILGKPRFDQSFANSALSVTQDGKPRFFKRGLAMKSRSQVTYRLAKKYQRFQTTVGIDPDAADQGDVELKLLADGKEVLSQSIAKADPPIEIDIPVSEANRLTIVVGYGKNLDIGDQLHLGDARFTK